MSYIYNNEIKYSDSENLDAFGRLRVSQTTTLLDLKHLYDKLPLLIDEEIGGSGTSSFSNSSVSMSTTNSGDYVIRQSIKSAPYQSGKSQLVEASFSNFATQSNVIKRVGYYTSTTNSPYNSGFDGFFLESNGVNNSITFQLWKGGSNVVTATSSSWLTTDYDVSLIDWTKSQLMFVDFQWLGVGRIRFYMFVDGVPKLFYTTTGANNLSTVYMNCPNKPVRYEIRQSGIGSGSFEMICSGVSMEGSINSLYNTLNISDFTERTLPLSNTNYAVLGIRLVGTPSQIGVSGAFTTSDILQTSNDNYLVTIQKSPILSSTASWIKIDNTPIEYSFGSGNITVSTDGFVMGSFMGKSGALSQEKYEMNDNAFSLGYSINGTPKEWWICIKSTGANSKFRTGVGVKYFK